MCERAKAPESRSLKDMNASGPVPRPHPSARNPTIDAMFPRIMKFEEDSERSFKRRSSQDCLG